MLGLFTHFGSSSGIGALGLNLSSFIIQLLTFIIALLVLKRWAFKPILKIMNERRETIAKGVELGEQMQREKKELEAKVETELHNAREKADSIITAAKETAKDEARKAEAEAAVRAENIIKAAKAQTEQDVAIAKKKLESEIVDLVANATEVIAGEKVDSKKDASLINRALAEVER